jgi:transposase
MSIPGVKSFSAHVIVSEIGFDMSRFPSAAHLISWACISRKGYAHKLIGKRGGNRISGTSFRMEGNEESAIA